MPFNLLTGSVRLMADPTVGVHALVYYPNSSGFKPMLSTPAMTTQTSGSTMLVWVGRGWLGNFRPATVPTDNQGNIYEMVGSAQSYAPKWPGSGEALYAAPLIAGGDGHVVSSPMPSVEEVTSVVVEVKNGGVIQDVQSSVLLSRPLISPSVTTTDPATLVAIWAGDGSVAYSAVPDNGFTIIEQLFSPGTPYIQVAVATKEVTNAGTYNVMWEAAPWQGAHLWLVAVQSRPVAPPGLTARLQGERLVVSWPVSAIGYELEMSTLLSEVALWSSVTNQPVVVDGYNVVTNTITSNASFYRLKKL